MATGCRFSLHHQLLRYLSLILYQLFIDYRCLHFNDNIVTFLSVHSHLEILPENSKSIE
jgi:hypothetical protein